MGKVSSRTSTVRRADSKGHGRPAPMVSKAGYTGNKTRTYRCGGKASK